MYSKQAIFKSLFCCCLIWVIGKAAGQEGMARGFCASFIPSARNQRGILSQRFSTLPNFQKVEEKRFYSCKLTAFQSLPTMLSVSLTQLWATSELSGMLLENEKRNPLTDPGQANTQLRGESFPLSWKKALNWKGFCHSLPFPKFHGLSFPKLHFYPTELTSSVNIDW